jgi:hypothetical protein
MYNYREPELNQYRSIWLTEKSYKLLRNQKRKKKLSLAKILDNLIIEKYGKQGM